MDMQDFPPPCDWDQMLRFYNGAGWYSTLLTFMFDHMHGNQLAIQSQQTREVTEIYGRALTRVVRDPTRPSRIGRLPIWFCSADFPVFKHRKQALRDVTINDGQHVHAVVLTPPRNRLGEMSLARFVRENEALLTGSGRCLRIHAEPIFYDEAYVLRYVRKSEDRRRIDEDAFFVLPRSLSEVRAGSTEVGRQSSIFAVPKKKRGS